MLSHGHADAMRYPVGMVVDESNLIIERQNSKMATETLLLQQAINAILSKDARKQFTKTLKSLTSRRDPYGPWVT